MPKKTRVALVTGGSRGLGRSTVLALAEQNICSIFTYNANRSAADEVVGLARAAGVHATALQLDTGDTGAFEAFTDEVRRVLAGWGVEWFDYLVNNAGTSHHALLEEVTEEDFDALYLVHLEGVFFLTQRLLPLLAGGGRIVSISSGLTRVIYPGSAAYGTMKAAVEVLKKYMAKELGPRRLAANVVAPGAIQTDFSGSMVRDNPEVNERVSEVTCASAPKWDPSQVGHKSLMCMRHFVRPGVRISADLDPAKSSNLTAFLRIYASSAHGSQGGATSHFQEHQQPRWRSTKSTAAGGSGGGGLTSPPPATWAAM